MRHQLVWPVLCLCLSAQLYAQSYQESFQVESNFAANINAVFENVNLAEVQTGFLYDIGMHFDTPMHFDGQVQI
jgi:hypothetical protein